MPRKPRIEVEGGLYHIISRGNNRQLLFRARDDYEKLLSLLETQKDKLPFYLYAYCMMPNHIHLLVERRTDPLSRIMQRILTGYAQFHNRKYKTTGHLLQGRYKAILCDTDQYLAELVRYIHLNPVRAGIVARPEDYEYSSHSAYLGTEQPGIVDVDSVLRHFGGKKKLARETYAAFVKAAMTVGHQKEFYQAEGGRILGSEEFIDATIHRVGETGKRGAKHSAEATRELSVPDANAIVEAVEKVIGLERKEFFGAGKSAAVILAKEALILVAREAGGTTTMLSNLTGMNTSSISRRHESAKRKIRGQTEMKRLVSQIANLVSRTAE